MADNHTDCPFGSIGYGCMECISGYSRKLKHLRAVSGIAATANDVCSKCPSVPICWFTISTSVLMISLGCIVLSMLNVSTGFNRRTIHSIVIKIFLAYLASLSTYESLISADLMTGGGNVSNQGLGTNIGAANFWHHFSNIAGSVQSLDFYPFECVLLTSTGYRFPARFFAATIAYCLVPAAVIIFATLISSLVFLAAKRHERKRVAKRLRLLHMLQSKNLDAAADQVAQEIDSARLFYIWRYVDTTRQLSLTGMTIRFFKDMVPIYFVIGVSLYTSIIRRAAMPISCMYDKDGHLRNQYAPSVFCDSDDTTFAVWRPVGHCILWLWGLGLPFFCFITLWRYRRRLSDPDVRQRYGFLHNGYRANKWYWETVIFIKKASCYFLPIFQTIPESATGPSPLIALLFSLAFIFLHGWNKPYDRRNRNILGFLENLSLLTWTASMCLVYYNVKGQSSPLVLDILVIIINVTFCAYLLIVLYFELCEWARQTTISPKRLLKPFAMIMKLMIKQSEARRGREPRLELDPAIDQVTLKASGISKLRSVKTRLKPYAAMSPLIHVESTAPNFGGQTYFVKTIVGVYEYFLSQLEFGRISGEMALYLIRQSLVSHYIDTTEKSQVTKLSDVAEELFPKVVELYKIRKEAEETAAKAKKLRMKMELEAFYAGNFGATNAKKNAHVPPVDDALKEELFADIFGTDDAVNVSSLLDYESALSSTLTVDDFYTTIYMIEQQTSAESFKVKFRNFETMKRIRDAEELDNFTKEIDKLNALRKILESVLSRRKTILLTQSKLEALLARVGSLEKKLEKIRKTKDYCSQKPEDFCRLLLEKDESGYDSLRKRF